MSRGEHLIAKKVLLASDELEASTALGRAVRALASELKEKDVVVVESASMEDTLLLVMSDPGLQAILVDWSPRGETSARLRNLELLKGIRSRHAKIPVFILARRDEAAEIDPAIMQEADELVWLLEDTPFFIAGRVLAAIHRYRAAIAPPLTSALIAFAEVYEYSWHTPGHAGGTAFLKSPIGRVFHSYFGENLLRSDLSISVGELGSLLDHSGPIGESENYAARVFGADRSYCVTNGTSTSNRIIMMASVTRGDYALCDRNAHKSIEQSLAMTGAVPTYLVPTRNHLGLIGPVPASRLAASALEASLRSNPLARDKARPFVHAILTNSTYDGLTYRVGRVTELLGAKVDRIHFDEAWYGYARFHPMYEGRHAMAGDPKDHDRTGPTLFAGTSTHKLLAALSQASLIHIRDGRNPIEHARFNEAFMMHSSTSPQYAIIVSNEVTAAMMEGPGGRMLVGDSIAEAVAFRKALHQAHRAAQGDWMFTTWNPPEVLHPVTGERFAFADAPDELLCQEPSCWFLRPGDAWHGFPELEDDYCMLDPIKVSVIAPGVREDGTLGEWGIPATLVTAYLGHRGIVVEKTTDFTILFLFSLGITPGKYGTLLNALYHFKRDHDRNAPLAEVLPSLLEAAPRRYAGMGLKDLAGEMFEQIRATDQLHWQAQAFSTLPLPRATPADTYSRLVRGEVEAVSLDLLPGRTVATGVVPYPPGIPMLMPGESAGAADGPYLSYLEALQAWDRRFPGFGHDIHGVANVDGTYHVHCTRD